MAKLETKSEEAEIEIKYSGNTILVDNEHFSLLVQSLRRLDEDVPLASFNVEETDPVQHSYSYEFVAKDGREWKQEMHISTTDPDMSFDVDDFWKLSEFQYHRPIRDVVVYLVYYYGVTEIKVTWA